MCTRAAEPTRGVERKSVVSVRLTPTGRIYEGVAPQFVCHSPTGSTSHGTVRALTAFNLKLS